MSNGLTGDEIVTMPNLVMFGALMSVKRERAPMLPFVSKAINTIFGNPKSPFIKVRVMDFLFNGVGFSCEGTDFGSKAVCAGIKSEGPAQGVHILNETYFSVSVLGHVSQTLFIFFTQTQFTNISSLI